MTTRRRIASEDSYTIDRAVIVAEVSAESGNYACDRIEIETVPRFKTSPFTGNEWRTSTRTTYYRGDTVVLIDHYGGPTVKIELDHLIHALKIGHKLSTPPTARARASLSLKGMLRQTVEADNMIDMAIVLNGPLKLVRADPSHLCDQMGCQAPWVNVYSCTDMFCKPCGRKFDATGREEIVARVVAYCAEHSDRGDSNLNDRNKNLVLVEGPGAVPRPVVPSQTYILDDNGVPVARLEIVGEQ